MNKTERYIQEYTRNCSNELDDGSFSPWLTPDQAKAAAKIAVEEYKERIYQEVQDFTDSYHKDPTDKLAESISKLAKSLGYVRENTKIENESKSKRDG